MVKRIQLFLLFPQFLRNIDTDFALTKEYPVEMDREFALQRVVYQTGNKGLQTNISRFAEILQSGRITREFFWALQSDDHSLDMFLNGSFHDLLYQSGNDKDVGG